MPIKNYAIFLKVSLHFLLISLITFAACANKKRSFIPDDSQTQVLIPKLKIKKLELPVICGIKTETQDNYLLISWKIPKIKIISCGLEPKLLGYNVYKFEHNGFLKRRPINKEIIKDNYFKTTKSNYEYMVRGVYEVDGKVIEGPASQITA